MKHPGRQVDPVESMRLALIMLAECHEHFSKDIPLVDKYLRSATIFQTAVNPTNEIRGMLLTGIDTWV
jgi:hypothetical protein